jgi:hypothetical protein
VFVNVPALRMGQHISIPITNGQLLAALHGHAYVDVSPPVAQPVRPKRDAAPKRERPASSARQLKMQRLQQAAQALASDPLASAGKRNRASNQLGSSAGSTGTAFPTEKTRSASDA